VNRTLDDLERAGYEVRRAGVDAEGRLDFEQLRSFVDDGTALISVMHANNETGVLFDIGPIAAMADEAGVPLHVDAVQSAGKVGINVSAAGGTHPTTASVDTPVENRCHTSDSPVENRCHTGPIHLLSLSAHKFHGPKGVGALYVRSGTRVGPILTGGHQERDLRAGTEAVPQIVGMGVAAELAAVRLSAGLGRLAGLRDGLEEGILRAIPEARVFGRQAARIGNTTTIGFAQVAAEAMLILLSQAGICASSGAACSSGAIEPSHVLRAMGVEERYLHGAIRFSLSHLNTREEVERVVEVIPDIVARLSRAGLGPGRE
jgi:cysteine desulfurase